MRKNKKPKNRTMAPKFFIKKLWYPLFCITKTFWKTNGSPTNIFGTTASTLNKFFGTEKHIIVSFWAYWIFSKEPKFSTLKAPPWVFETWWPRQLGSFRACYFFCNPSTFQKLSYVLLFSLFFFGTNWKQVPMFHVRIYLRKNVAKLAFTAEKTQKKSTP